MSTSPDGAARGDDTFAPDATRFASKGVTSIGRFLRWSALILFVFFPLLLTAIFIVQSERIAEAAAARVPIEQEVQLGEHAFAALRATLPMAQSGAAYDAVSRLGSQLTAGSQYHYRFYIAADDAVDALAIPGGIVVVYRGLVDATERPEELAGVLAHQVQHIEQRHALAAVVKDLGLRGIWALFTGDVASGWIEQAAASLANSSFSHEAEMQADARAIDALVAAGIDPHGMSEFFSRAAPGERAPFAMMHPMSADRIAALSARLDVRGDQGDQGDE